MWAVHHKLTHVFRSMTGFDRVLLERCSHSFDRPLFGRLRVRKREQYVDPLRFLGDFG